MEKEQKIILVRIFAGASLFAAALLVPSPSQTRLLLCVAAYLIVGFDILLAALRNLLRGRPFDENFLMGAATVGAFFIGEYPEAVAVMLFFRIGELFQEVAVSRSRTSIRALLDLRPDWAEVEEAGGLRRVAPASVAVGSVILVRPGERIPLDGKVLSGRSSLDTAALTGESLPRDVAPGDMVLSGTLNLTGVLRIRTTDSYGDSTVARILDLVEHADTGRARTERFITRFARYYTPLVVAAAVLLALVPPLLGGGTWAEWLNRALLFLVISCPCALVVSVPLTFFAGIGGASRRGILIKGSNVLEELARVRTVVFDKTGTLTQGDFSVVAVHPAQGISTERLLERAALAECDSPHPVAEALRRKWGGLIDRSRVKEMENLAGEGVVARIDGTTVYVGNERLMRRAGFDVEPCRRVGTIVHVAGEERYLGHVVVADRVKPQAAEAVDRLEREGIHRLAMLTGDRAEVAAEVARAVGIGEYHAGLLPADKVACMEALRGEGFDGGIAFVGDGINDAPVLRLADVGIAMGGAGSDAAIEAADVVLMDDDPTKVAVAIRSARRTLGIARQNILLAVGIKAAILLLGALGVADMWEAVFADVGVTVLAVLNALRAMRAE